MSRGRLVFDAEHPPIKWLRKVNSSRSELSRQYCLVEGWKCIEEAWLWGEPQLILCVDKAKEQVDSKGWAGRCPLYSLENKEMEELCSTRHPEGVLAVFDRPEISVEAPRGLSGEVHLGLYNWRDPSNIGAVVRTARGLGASSVSLMGTGPDFFSTKVIRCSMASVFHMKLHQLEGGLESLETFNIVMAAAGGEASRTWQPDKRATFLLIGSESHGLPKDLLESAQVLGIPLANELESLSAPIASALLLDHCLFPRRPKEN